MEEKYSDGLLHSRPIGRIDPSRLVFSFYLTNNNNVCIVVVVCLVLESHPTSSLSSSSSVSLVLACFSRMIS